MRAVSRVACPSHRQQLSTVYALEPHSAGDCCLLSYAATNPFTEEVAPLAPKKTIKQKGTTETHAVYLQDRDRMYPFTRLHTPTFHASTELCHTALCHGLSPKDNVREKHVGVGRAFGCSWQNTRSLPPTPPSRRLRHYACPGPSAWPLTELRSSHRRRARLTFSPLGRCTTAARMSSRLTDRRQTNNRDEDSQTTSSTATELSLVGLLVTATDDHERLPSSLLASPLRRTSHRSTTHITKCSYRNLECITR